MEKFDHRNFIPSYHQANHTGFAGVSDVGHGRFRVRCNVGQCNKRSLGRAYLSVEEGADAYLKHQTAVHGHQVTEAMVRHAKILSPAAGY